MDAARFAEVHVLAMDYTRGYVYIMEQDKLRRIDTSKEKNSGYVDYHILLSLSKNWVSKPGKTFFVSKISICPNKFPSLALALNTVLHWTGQTFWPTLYAAEILASKKSHDFELFCHI